MRARNVIGALVLIPVLTFVLLIPIGVLLNLLIPPNEVTGDFSDAHSVHFDVTDSSNYEPLVIHLRVSYRMTRAESYTVGVTVERDGRRISEETLVIHSTSTSVQTESAETVISVAEPGSYTIVLSPRGYQRSIDFSIEQPRTGVFEEGYVYVVGIAVVISISVVWWYFLRSPRARPPSLPPPPPPSS